MSLSGVLHRLRTNDSTLQCLTFRHSFCFNGQELQELAAALTHNTTLTRLRIYMMDVNISRESLNAGVQALAAVLAQNTTLKVLEFLYCACIRDAGVQALASALQRNTTLISLTFAHCWVSDEGARALANVLACNCTLTTVCFEDNAIRDSGARALAVALEKNWTLTVLNVQANFIRDTSTLHNMEATLCRNKATQQRRKAHYAQAMRAYRMLLIVLRTSESNLPPTLVLDVHETMRMLVDNATS